LSDPDLVAALRGIVGEDACLVRPEDLFVYEADGLTLHRARPRAVVLPQEKKEVARIVKTCRAHGVPFVARGAGTGLSGGALALEGGVVIGLARMNRILEVNLEDRYAVVQPGVINAEVSKAAAPYGLFYAPDPSSQAACTIGGNVAENSGGAHTLKYGTTTDHVLALEVVLPDGEFVTLGSRTGWWRHSSLSFPTWSRLAGPSARSSARDWCPPRSRSSISEPSPPSRPVSTRPVFPPTRAPCC
jgi:FAD/FMN-containing dehydrogenase